MSQNLVIANRKYNTSNVYNVVEELQDYMFTSANLTRYNKNIYVSSTDAKKYVKKNDIYSSTNIQTKISKNNDINKDVNKDKNYKPLKKDSLFWCFFILKYGYSKYEMDIGSQHFIIEKNEKFANIDLLRIKENKDTLKIHKIKPLSDLEDDLANKERISIKTFFALCIINKMNILLVEGRKIYQSINNDSDIIHVVHRNSTTFEHHIELNVTQDMISKYRDTYYNVSGFDNALKSISSYTVDELHEICEQLNINIDAKSSIVSNSGKKKKLTKKDMYELIIQNF
jgi:hypothetical protein